MEIAPSQDYEAQVLGYMHEALEEGEMFLRAQKGYAHIDETIKAIMGETTPVQSPSFSRTTVNHISKVATDLTAVCTDVKPFWEYQTKNEHFKDHCQILGDLSEHWWLNRLIDLKNADVVRYSLAAGSSYAHHYYNTNTMDLDVAAEDPRDILPIRPPSVSFSLQEAAGVIHRVQRTVNYVRMLYPDKAHLIVPDREGSFVSQSLDNTRISKLFDMYGSPFKNQLFSDAPAKELPRIPSVDLYTCYLRDDSINKGSRPLFMGEWSKEGRPLKTWSYQVDPGDKIYPRKRCIVFTKTAILYDGPSIYWHGLYPYAKLTLDPWPWSWLGKGILWDILPLQNSLQNILRCLDDHLEKVARPPVKADKATVSQSDVNKIDTRKAGLKIRQNMMIGKGIEILDVPNLPQDVLKILQYYEDKLYEIPGVKDFSELMKLKQMPAPETIERLQETMSPSIRLRSRIIEAYMREFATMAASNFTQFYTLSDRLAILGERGATKDDFDQDPGTFLPAFGPKDYESGVLKEASIARGPLPRYERAAQFYTQVSYHIASSSLLNASEIETQLKYLQLSRAGLVDHWTLLDVLNIPNVGSPPPNAKTITDRLMAEQQMGLGMIVSSTGRKSSGQEPPQQKSSGATSESG
jgi:hypothetical protein